jgi:hypothetical protein
MPDVNLPPVEPAPPPKHDLFLRYLDKEMTIMGILSAFCAAVIAAVLSKVFEKPGDQTELMRHVIAYGQWLLGLGIVATATAMWLFYQQRATLAYHFGQVSYHLSLSDYNTAEEAIVDSHEWSIWFPYYYGLGFLLIAIASFLAALIKGHVSATFGPIANVPHVPGVSSDLMASMLIGVAGLGATRMVIAPCKSKPASDEPWPRKWYYDVLLLLWHGGRDVDQSNFMTKWRQGLYSERPESASEIAAIRGTVTVVRPNGSLFLEVIRLIEPSRCDEDGDTLVFVTIDRKQSHVETILIAYDTSEGSWTEHRFHYLHNGNEHVELIAVNRTAAILASRMK